MRLLVGLVTAALLLAGCTGGGASPSASTTPSAPISVSTSPGPSPSRTGPLTTGPGVRPGEKPPVLDPAGLKHDETGALAFAAYYYRSLDWSLATSDALLLREVSAAGCTTCQSHITSIEKLATTGEKIEGGRITIDSLQLTHRREARQADFVVAVTSKQQEVSLVSRSGAQRTVSPASSGTSYVLLSWIASGWKVIEESRT